MFIISIIYLSLVQLLVNFGIITTLGLLLTSLREVAHTLQITNDTCHIVDVFAVTYGAFLKVSLVDMTTIVADSVRNIECKVVASFLGSDTQQLAILRF